VVVVIAAVVVSVVMVIGILAAIAIPSFIKYQRRAESSEATFSLSRIVYAATAYWDADRDGERDEGGELVASRLRRFPDSVDWTPRMPPCEGGGHRYEPDEKDWEHSTWKALAFAMTTRHRYRYRFTSRGQGDSATFTVEAEGDLNCNGLRSHYQRVGRVKDGKVVVDPVQSENPLDFSGGDFPAPPRAPTPREPPPCRALPARSGAWPSAGTPVPAGRG
jgi:type II secretory pathway pseudopilin PulG